MGNTESSDSFSTRHRAKSQSPIHNRNGGSVRESSVSTEVPRQCMSVVPARRSKTCRHKGIRRREVCSVTGLTLHQKALLMRKWNRMEPVTVYRLGKRMFESVFNENPHYLAYIDLKGEANWKNHINFKIHVQRFVIALSEAMRRLREPSTSYDVLRDFGASYATYPKRVSAVYFERLANALSHTAVRLQESDHQSIEKATSREEDSYSSEGDKSYRSFLDVDKMNAVDEIEIAGSKSFSSFSTPRHNSSSRTSLSQMSCMRDDLQSECIDHGRNGICPITAEAWTVLSAFLANQIKYGYETERVIRTEMSKLGLDGSGNMKRGEFSVQRPTQFV